MADFCIKTWAGKFELTEETMTALAKKGFNSYQTISRITQEILQKDFVKVVNTAQYLMLSDAVGSLQTQARPVAASSDIAESSQAGTSTQIQASSLQACQDKLTKTGSLAVADLLSLMGNAENLNPAAAQPQQRQRHGSSPEHLTSSGNQHPSLFDPFAPPINVTQRKFRDIRDYISLVRKGERGVDPTGTLTLGALEVPLQLKESKIPLEKVQLSQYMEASLKILKAMIDEDQINMSTVQNYLGYVIKIATFSQSFRWESVLRYDHEYRKGQAESGFPWGSDSPYLMQLHLQSNAPSHHNYSRDNARGKTQGRPVATHKNKFDPACGKPICRKYNYPSGCDLRQCKFSHVCQTCYGTHSDCSASSAVTKPPSQPATSSAPAQR